MADDGEHDEAAQLRMLLALLTRARGGMGMGVGAQQTRVDKTPAANRHAFEEEQAAALQHSPLSREIRGSREAMGGFGSRGVQRFASRLVPHGMPSVALGFGRTRIYSSTFSPSGKLLIVASQDESLFVMDVASWTLRKRIDAREVRWTITSTDVTPNDEFVLYTSIHDTMHLCNLKDGAGELHEQLCLDDEDDPCGLGTWCARFSAGGQEVLAGCGNRSNGVGELVVYDIERKRVAHRAAAHHDDINAVCFADPAYTPHVLVSGSDDCMIKVWDRRTMPATYDRSQRQLLKAAGYLTGHHAGITSLDARGDGRYVLSNSKDQTVKLWDLRKMATHAEAAAMPAPDRDGSEWDYRGMDYPFWGTKWKHPSDLSAMTYRGHSVRATLIRAKFSPWSSTGGRYAYAGSADGRVSIWDALTGEIVSRFEGATHVIRDVSWHPDKPMLVTASWDGSVRVFDTVRSQRRGVAGAGKELPITPDRHYDHGGGGSEDDEDDDDEDDEDEEEFDPQYAEDSEMPLALAFVPEPVPRFAVRAAPMFVIAPRLAVNGTTVDSSYQPTPEELEGTAIITMASDDDAGLMALALMQSLRDVETRVPRLIVMLMKGGRASCHKAPGGCNYTDPGHVLAKDITDALVGLGVELRFMSPLPITEFTNQISGGAQAFWGMAFNKLTIFGMTEFRKLLWLDSDTLMLRNVDHLLVQPSFTAAFTNDCNNRAAPAKISGGMWVVEPSKARMDEILELTRTGKLGEGQEWRLGDMEIVLYLFAKFTRASREGGLWPKSYDIRQGRVPGLELFNSDYAKGGARADVPAGPLPSELAEARAQGKVAWLPLDVRYDYLVQECGDVPDRFLGLPRDAAAEIGLADAEPGRPWGNGTAPLAAVGLPVVRLSAEARAAWKPLTTRTGYNAGLISLHFSCMSPPHTKPSGFEDEAGMVKSLMAFRPPCARQALLLWYSKIIRATGSRRLHNGVSEPSGALVEATSFL
ncbi:hypothetical protein FNF28_01051 [Cafeteria roenbergensis]|uniref:Uncharacterized protein n=1 Tax=Cafeteria roenbergensis TaxID=33653 RepID=A0A5A8DZW5_CAFRO|nr:hypothetical protein FNF28_01051 [Cafeteria roenbergensis]